MSFGQDYRKKSSEEVHASAQKFIDEMLKLSYNDKDEILYDKISCIKESMDRMFSLAHKLASEVVELRTAITLIIDEGDIVDTIENRILH